MLTPGSDDRLQGGVQPNNTPSFINPYETRESNLSSTATTLDLFKGIGGSIPEPQNLKAPKIAEIQEPKEEKKENSAFSFMAGMNINTNPPIAMPEQKKEQPDDVKVSRGYLQPTEIPIQ